MRAAGVGGWLVLLAVASTAVPAAAQEEAPPEETLPENRPWYQRGVDQEHADAPPEADLTGEAGEDAPGTPPRAPAAVPPDPPEPVLPADAGGDAVAPDDAEDDAAGGADVAAPEPGDADDWPGPLAIDRPLFGEEEHPEDVTEDWKLTFHGYSRMALRFHGAAQRPPYLVDDDYFLSGFNYTRVNEREWAEVFLGAQRDRTRFVLGLFASQFSDWSETTLQGQGGIATAFVEHTAEVSEDVELGARVGMFWDRYGYVDHYDTYLFGRTHVAGIRGHLRLFDRFYLKTGFGAHADVVSSNQGFTPVIWASGGVDLGWLDVALHAFHVWTSDSEREFAIIEDGSLDVLGADARVALSHFGQLYVGLAHYDAERVLFLSNGLELLHSTGGRGLTESFFGLNAENGTGSALVAAFELTWEPALALSALAGRETGRAARGLELRFFGLLASVGSEQSSADPLENRDDRTYFKWGTELFYRPPFEGWDWWFAGLRYDRVVLDTDHDSMSFRVFSPRVGVTPMEGLDVYLQYAHYAYGDNVSLRPNQIPGDVSVTAPDDHAFKLQAQVGW